MKAKRMMAIVVLIPITYLLFSGPTGACKEATINGEAMLVGEITQDELYRDYPVFLENASDYVPDPDAISELRSIQEPITIIMFLGTWCTDSEREGAHFMKVMDVVQSPRLSLSLYGVDRAKDDGKGLAKLYRVERVPTIIFLRGEKEIGRIVENPQESVEKDFLAIVKSGA